MDARLKNILEPVSVDRPCGEDLSFSAEFDRILEARREDDPTVDYGEWQTTLKQADWKAVLESSRELLENRSKDLRLAAWLTEGLAKTAGLAGLADGIETVAQLIDRFGNDIHPQAEQGDQEHRIGTLTWFVMRMSQLARQIPLTLATCGQFSLNDYESARNLQAQLQRNAEQTADIEDKLILDKFSAAVSRTDKTLYGQWIADAERCVRMQAELARACDVLFGDEGPSFAPLTGALDAVLQRLRVIANDLGPLAADTPVATAPDPAGEPAAQKATPSIIGAVTTRAQALEALRQVAKYFRDNEPHSPVAYLADKAARWGAMPLHSWLRSVVKDNGTLSHIEELLGMDIEGEQRA